MDKELKNLRLEKKISKLEADIAYQKRCVELMEAQLQKLKDSWKL